MSKFKYGWLFLLTGGVFGIWFAWLAKLGNPPNMGTCVICFTRDIAGALGLHKILFTQFEKGDRLFTAF